MVGIGTTTPDASSALDITSTTKGFLMPRMTTTERTAIATPATGLQVYDTTTNSQWYYNGTAWVQGASKADASKWTNDATNTRVALTNLSDGTTTRPAGKEFVITDTGNVGIGTSSPINKFELINNSFVPNTIGGDGGVALYHTDNTSKLGVTLVNKYNVTGGSTVFEKRGQYNGIGVYGTGGYKKVSSMANDVYFGLKYNTDGSGTVVDLIGEVENAYAQTNFIGNLANSLILLNARASVFSVNNFASGIIRNATGVFVDAVKATGTDASNPHKAYGILISNDISASGGSTNEAFALASNSTVPSYFSGNLGIGTTTPLTKLHVNNGAILAGESGKVLVGRYNSEYPNPVNGSAGFFTLKINNVDEVSGGLTIFNLMSGIEQPQIILDGYGKVGIGVTAPVEKLEVAGAIKIGTTTTATPSAGTIRFNTTTSKFEGYDGTAWVAFH